MGAGTSLALGVSLQRLLSRGLYCCALTAFLYRPNAALRLAVLKWSPGAVAQILRASAMASMSDTLGCGSAFCLFSMIFT